MLARSLRVPPAFVCLLVFLAFFGWQLSQGPSHEEGSVSMAPIAADAPAEQQKKPRVALMTFVTEERSYHHLSLKSKDRESINVTPLY